eukprot:g3765.t1
MRKPWRQKMRAAVVFFSAVLLFAPTVYSNHNNPQSRADELAIDWCNFIGDVAFAISGAVAGGEAGMDLVGCMMMAFVTALGGGSIRDVILGQLPLFWLTQPAEMAV